MSSYVLAMAYALAMLASCVGWGVLLQRACRWRAGVDWGLRAVWGIGLVTFVGGTLNLVGMAGRPALLGLLAGGAVIWAASTVAGGCNAGTTRPRVGSPGTASVLLLTLACAVLAARFATTHSLHYNDHDDYQGYFVYPQKMIQTGTLGRDPYSERRLVSALGGQYVLDAIFLAEGGAVWQLDLVDSGFGLLILAGVTWGLLRQRRVAPVVAAGALLALAVTLHPKANITSHLTAAAMFLGLYRTLGRPREQDGDEGSAAPLGRACLGGLMAATLLSLKLQFLPTVAMYLAATCGTWLLGARGNQARRRAAGEVVVLAATLVLALSPWLVASYRAVGTPLYPLLGRGYHASAYGNTFRATAFQFTAGALGRALFSTFAMAVPLAMLVALGALLACPRLRFRSCVLGKSSGALPFALAAIIGALVIIAGTGGFQGYPYTFPIILAGLVVLLAELAAGDRADVNADASAAPVRTGALAVALTGFVIGGAWPGFRVEMLDRLGEVRNGVLRGGAARADEEYRHRYRAMQAAVPLGQTIIERLERPYLLDFRRNLVMVVDYPGVASPPPGMPMFRGPEPLARFLLGQGIRYVAYDYASEARFTRAAYADRLLPGTHAWTRAEAENTLDFQQNLQELGRSRRHLYDDGRTFLLDLAQRSSGE